MGYWDFQIRIKRTEWNGHIVIIYSAPIGLKEIFTKYSLRRDIKIFVNGMESMGNEAILYHEIRSYRT